MSKKYRVSFQEQKGGKWKVLEMYASSVENLVKSFNLSVPIKNLQDCYDYNITELED